MIGGKSNDEMFKQLDSLMLGCEMGHASARTRHATTIAAQLRLALIIANGRIEELESALQYEATVKGRVADLESEVAELKELREERPNLLKALHTAEYKAEALEAEVAKWIFNAEEMDNSNCELVAEVAELRSRYLGIDKTYELVQDMRRRTAQEIHDMVKEAEYVVWKNVGHPLIQEPVYTITNAIKERYNL